MSITIEQLPTHGVYCIMGRSQSGKTVLCTEIIRRERNTNNVYIWNTSEKPTHYGRINGNYTLLLKSQLDKFTSLIEKDKEKNLDNCRILIIDDPAEDSIDKLYEFCQKYRTYNVLILIIVSSDGILHKDFKLVIDYYLIRNDAQHVLKIPFNPVMKKIMTETNELNGYNFMFIDANTYDNYIRYRINLQAVARDEEEKREEARIEAEKLRLIEEEKKQEEEKLRLQEEEKKQSLTEPSAPILDLPVIHEQPVVDEGVILQEEPSISDEGVPTTAPTTAPTTSTTPISTTPIVESPVREDLTALMDNEIADGTLVDNEKYLLRMKYQDILDRQKANIDAIRAEVKLELIKHSADTLKYKVFKLLEVPQIFYTTH